MTQTREERSQAIDEEKRQIRERVWNDEETGETEFYPADPQPTIDDDSPKRVAAYARVSTLSTEQTSSIEYQTKFYTDKIENTPNWSFAGIYSDEGKSGTSMKRRTEFKRLLQDARNGNIDLIICASVSRFARNISDCIDQVNFLKSNDPKHPVGVYFETENIYTLDPNSSQSLDMHAMLADWESATKSRRMLLSYDQRIIMKHYPVSDLLGYRHTKDGKLEINEDEAITVRYIFLARLIGQSYQEIAEVLTDKERSTLSGRTDWDSSMVANVTKNERRWGDLEARKTVVVDYKRGKTARNTYEENGEIHHIRSGAMVHDHHEGIVTPEIAKATHMVGLNSGGISDIYVISDGALKGFVNVSPNGTGLDDAVFLDACHSVYTEQEFECTKQEADYFTGKQHTNVIDMTMHEYEVPHGSLCINMGTPAITISKRRIQMNQKLLDRFKDCTYLEILYHPILQMLAFRTCNGNSSNAVCLKDDDGGFKKGFAAPGLCHAIYERMDWIENFSFKLRGVYRQRNGFEIMLFYLDEPLVIPDKATRDEYKVKEKDKSIHYIPYRNAEYDENGNRVSEDILRPDFGVPIQMRIKRDRLLHSITGDDINKHGQFVKNTHLGDIPTRSEVLAELEQLLMSM